MLFSVTLYYRSDKVGLSHFSDNIGLSNDCDNGLPYTPSFEDQFFQTLYFFERQEVIWKKVEAVISGVSLIVL